MAERSTATLYSTEATIEDAVIPPRRLSPLELLHPDGIAERSLLIGCSPLALLRPESSTRDGKNADLVLLAPTIAECRAGGWLESAVQLLAQKLAADGIAYVLAPPRWRLRIKSLLHWHGLWIETTIAHLPNLASSHYLMPIDPIPARFMFSKLTASHPWGRRFARLALCLPGGEKLLDSLLPSVGLVARRPGGRPLFDWLFQLDGDLQQPRSVIVRRSWRGESGSVVLHRFTGGGAQPSAVAKMALTSRLAVNCVREAAIIGRLGQGARSVGVQVPQVLRLEQIGGYPVLIQTALGGQSVATLLASRSNLLLNLIERITSWLERWNRSTMIIEPLASEQLNQELLAPATLLAPLLQQGEDYLDWLTARCATVSGIPMPLVATHNDLTMWNILLDKQGQLGIIDWEMGTERGFPLVDFLYAVTDAVAAARGYANRLNAFATCFASGGKWARVVAQFQSRLRQAVPIPHDAADLCFHVCWLHHAANEHRSSSHSDPRPFLEIVQWLALNRSSIRWG